MERETVLDVLYEIKEFELFIDSIDNKLNGKREVLDFKLSLKDNFDDKLKIMNTEINYNIINSDYMKLLSFLYSKPDYLNEKGDILKGKIYSKLIEFYKEKSLKEFTKYDILKFTKYIERRRIASNKIEEIQKSEAIKKIKDSDFHRNNANLFIWLFDIIFKKKYWDYLNKKLLEFKKDAKADLQVNIGDKINIDEYKIHWKGNQVEFIQLVYGLFFAKLLMDHKNERTKIVEYLAKIMNFELGKKWDSNFSKNTFRENSGFDREKIFDKIRDGYRSYIDMKMEQKKNK